MEIYVPKPTKIEDVIGITGLAAPSESEWSETGNYVDGDLVKLSHDENGVIIFPYLLFRKTNTSRNTYPPTHPSDWTSLGSINRHAIFDHYRTNQSIADEIATEGNPSSFTITYNAMDCDRVSLINTDLTSVKIKIKTSAGGAFQPYTPANFGNIIDESYYPYVFNIPVLNFPEYIPKTFGTYGGNLIVPIPKTDYTQIQIEFINDIPGKTAKCGQLLCGVKNDIGLSQWNVEGGLLSASRKERNDETGDVWLRKGLGVKDLDIDVMVDDGQFDRVFAVLSMLDGIPCVIQGNNEQSNYDALFLYGYIDDFSFTIVNTVYSKFRLNVKGLI